jgi:polyisoprenoid-binding protein YceI
MTTTVETGAFRLDTAASTVTIRQKTMWGLVTVNGTFGVLRGEATVHPDGTATGTVTLDSASLDTKHAKRDAHLRTPDFLHVEEHPAITFDVRKATSRGGTAAVEGRLTVRGVTQPQSLTATLTDAGPDAVTLSTEFTVDRTQFGLTWNQLGMMRGLTTITASLRFTRVPA